MLLANFRWKTEKERYSFYVPSIDKLLLEHLLHCSSLQAPGCSHIERLNLVKHIQSSILGRRERAGNTSTVGQVGKRFELFDCLSDDSIRRIVFSQILLYDEN